MWECIADMVEPNWEWQSPNDSGDVGMAEKVWE